MGGSQARLATHAGKGLRPARDCCDTQPGSAVPTRVAATQQRGTDHRSRPGVPTLPSPCLHRWLIRSLNLTSPWNPGTPFARSLGEPGHNRGVSTLPFRQVQL